MVINSEITVKNLTKKFKQGGQIITILDDINLQFLQSHTYAVTGVSGTGKSTLMQLLAGLDAPTEGSVSFNGTLLKEMDHKTRQLFLNQSIGLVFQSPYLIRELTALENIIVPGIIADKSLSVCTARAKQLLAQIGLEDKQHEQPASLSGGQQQRVALARALFNQPAFLIADEPTGNLDLTTGNEIIKLLLDLQKQWGMGLIISTHDPQVTKAMTHSFELRNGKLYPLP